MKTCIFLLAITGTFIYKSYAQDSSFVLSHVRGEVIYNSEDINEVLALSLCWKRSDNILQLGLRGLLGSQSELFDQRSGRGIRTNWDRLGFIGSYQYFPVSMNHSLNLYFQYTVQFHSYYVFHNRNDTSTTVNDKLNVNRGHRLFIIENQFGLGLNYWVFPGLYAFAQGGVGYAPVIQVGFSNSVNLTLAIQVGIIYDFKNYRLKYLNNKIPE